MSGGPDICHMAEEKFSTYIFIRQRLRTERVGNQASERERLSPAENSLRKENFEVPPGADQANTVVWYVRTRYVHGVKIIGFLIEWNRG